MDLCNAEHALLSVLALDYFVAELLPWSPREGYSKKNWVRECGLLPKTLTLFMRWPKKFDTLFVTWPINEYPVSDLPYSGLWWPKGLPSGVPYPYRKEKKSHLIDLVIVFMASGIVHVQKISILTPQNIFGGTSDSWKYICVCRLPTGGIGISWGWEVL